MFGGRGCGAVFKGQGGVEARGKHMSNRLLCLHTSGTGAHIKQYPWTLLAQPARAGALGRTYRRPVLCTPLCKSGRVASPIPPHPRYPGHSPTISLTGALPDFWYQLRLVLGLFRRPTERDNGGTIRVWMGVDWDAWGHCGPRPLQSSTSGVVRLPLARALRLLPTAWGKAALGRNTCFKHAKPSSSPTH